MKPIRIYEHHDWAGAGYLLEFLGRQGLPYQLIPVSVDSAVDNDIDFSGLIFLGADYSVNDPYPSIASQLKIIRQAIKKRVPILGHCFGAQLISKALGGQVTPMPQWEIGWFQAAGNTEGLEQITHQTTATAEPMLLWHKEKLAVPATATPLFGTRHCADQAFVYNNNVLAIMAHFEATPEIVHGWVERFKHKVPLPQHHSTVPSIQSTANLLSRIERKSIGMHDFAETLYQHWLTQVLAFQDNS